MERAMSDTGCGSRQLVKDGIWQVSADERPIGWESMSVSEPEHQPETIADDAISTTLAGVAEATVNAQSEACGESFPIVSYLPEDQEADVKLLVEIHMQIHDRDDIPDGEMDQLCDLVWGSIPERISLHRKTKHQVDMALSKWVDKHRKKLRHVGIASEPIRELWSIFHAMLLFEKEAAAIIVERAKRRASHGKSCDCHYCLLDKDVK